MSVLEVANPDTRVAYHAVPLRDVGASSAYSRERNTPKAAVSNLLEHFILVA